MTHMVKTRSAVTAASVVAAFFATSPALAAPGEASPTASPTSATSAPAAATPEASKTEASSTSAASATSEAKAAETTKAEASSTAATPSASESLASAVSKAPAKKFAAKAAVAGSTSPAVDATGRVQFTLTKLYDGTGQGTSAGCDINSANGYSVGDNTTTDGVLCTNDDVGFRIDYNVQQSDTPTTVRLQFAAPGTLPDGSVAGTVAGSNSYPNGLNVNPNSQSQASVIQFCQGGGDYYHTGSYDVGTGICTLNFPAGKSGASSGNITLTSTGFYNQGTYTPTLNILPEGTVDPKKAISSTSTAPVTIVAGMHIDAELYRNGTPTLTYKNGVAGENQKMWLYNEDPRANNRSKGHFPLETPAGAVKGTYDIDFSSYPAGTVVTVPAGWTYDATTRHATVTDYSLAGIDAGTGWGPTDTEVKPFYNGIPFEIWVPTSAYDTTKDQTFTVKIAKAEYTTTLNMSDEGKKNWNGRVEPGTGQDASFSTENTYGSGSTRGRAGAPNNDYMVTQYDALAGAGSISKVIRADDNGNVGAQIPSTTYTPVNTNVWAEMIAKPSASAPTQATFCDVFANAATGSGQAIDTSRQAKVSWYNPETNAYETPDYTIEYGSASYAQSGPANAAEMTKGCNTTVANWSSTPDASTNVVRIKMNKPVAWQADKEYVGKIDLPMKTLDVGNYPNFPKPVALGDNFAIDANSSGNFSGGIHAQISVAGPIDDVQGMSEGRYTPQHVTAGSTLTMAPNNYTINSGGIHSADDPRAAKMSYVTTVGSCVSDIQFPDSFKNDFDYTIDKPDLGPDNLPCTGDDVHGWTVTYKQKDTTKLSDGAYNGVRGPGNWVFSVPGYVKGGTQIPISTNAAMIATPGVSSTETGGMSNNVDNRPIIVDTASTVGQSKLTTTPLVMTGSDVSWVSTWYNNSKQATGQGVFIDVLPYNGDAKGSTLAAPLSNVRISQLSENNGATVYVSTDDPSTINDDARAASNGDGGSTKWVAYTGAAQIDGEDITAIKVVQDKMDPGYQGGVTVTAATTGDADGDDLFNRMGVATVDGFALPVPVTAPVRSDIYNTKISGVAYWDANKDGKRDADESRRFANVSIDVLAPNGDIIKTVKTDENGAWSVEGLPLGDYTAMVSGTQELMDGLGTPSGIDGSTVPAGSVETGPTPDGVYIGELSITDHSDENLDFGFFKAVNGKLSITKSAEGIENGGSVTNGSTVTWNYLVSNDGDSTMSNIEVKDNRGVAVSCPSTTLAVGASMTCTGSGTVTPITTGDSSGG